MIYDYPAHRYAAEVIQMKGQSLKKSLAFHQYLSEYKGPSGKSIRREETSGSEGLIRYTGEFWTSRQRQASSLHEISYRACFKPQLPRFFINLLTHEGNIVYDPFGGRGTTAIEAGLLGRRVIVNDANPLSRVLTEPRFFPPFVEDVVLHRYNYPPAKKAGFNRSSPPSAQWVVYDITFMRKQIDKKPWHWGLKQAR